MANQFNTLGNREDRSRAQREDIVFWREKHWVFGPCTWMDLLLASCLRGSWAHEICRPNPIPKHHCLDEQFSQPSSDQGHLPEIR
ncbi:hypothetical protein ACSBR2_030574 [Camellia fascicularis]